MSTLLTSDLNPTQFPGKKQTISTFKLTLLLEPGSMIDYTTWIPGNKSKDLFNMPYHELEVEARFDNTILLSKQPLTENLLVAEVDLVDDHINTDHVFSISLTGKNQNHTFIFDNTNKDAVAMIRILLSIENLPINHFLETQPLYQSENKDNVLWSSFMGQNGTRLVQINTPIYSWLVKNSAHIISEIKLG